MDLAEKADRLITTYDEQDRLLALAESCTGGLVSGRVTSVPGASNVFLEGMVCYANDAKIMRLGVDPETLEEHGAVSEPVAVEMAEGAYIIPNVTDALSVTGVAGPSGGSDETPVGTVWFARKSHGEPVVTARKGFEGDRAAIRNKSVSFALDLLLDAEHGSPLHAG